MNECISNIVIGQRLHDLRKQKKLTIQEVADSVGLAKNSISCYENGTRRPNSTAMLKLANFYNKTVQELFFEQLFILKNTCIANMRVSKKMSMYQKNKKIESEVNPPYYESFYIINH